ncbi:U4/U6-U5 snRNP complex subunit prp3 [Pleodorina starrii]|uniref:U4/U6-U5 snRNP complex subunit prp3 n=1 Tax=Pleodorina starrii TaxID=330485 RepID=A0A9W6BUP2_9CHLO|nr:U4/U6-U5 snRNP complex subunit prp3 [Pleodorina starrii]GLC58714.1 U4/U6-U5 snRNP complex subunit prp3 [Pleodorina starrii]GLC75201.1 U4/U6-U5 snRNP complex subunit prp3 [Pleodorina starrii]
MDKREAESLPDGNAPAAKRGRWDSGPASAPGQNPAASAAALAAAVAAKYAQPPGARPVGFAPGQPGASLSGAPGSHLPSGAAAAVAQAAAAALQKLPIAAPGLVPADYASAAVSLGPGAAGSAAPAGAAPPRALNLDALEKAKKALQLQKEIQEKLKSKLPQLATKLATPAAGARATTVAGGGGAAVAGAAAVAAPAAPGAGAPLTAPGVVSVRPALASGMRLPGVPASLAAAAVALLPGGTTPAPGLVSGLGGKAAGISSVLPSRAPGEPPEPAPEEDDRFYDPQLARGAGARRGERRRRAGFDFVQEGRFQREAELFRMKSHLGASGFRKGAPRVSGPLLTHTGAGAAGDPNRIPLGGAAAAAMDANLVPLGVREKAAPASREATPAPDAEPVPAVEWWDRGVLAHASLELDVPELTEVALQAEAEGGEAMGGERGDMQIQGGKGEEAEERDVDMADASAAAEQRQQQGVGRRQRQERIKALEAAVERAAEAAAAGQLGPFQLKEARITIYVEHPVPLEPPAEAPPPPPQPLKLTQKELKKLRTQRRIARDKEKQELIRQGLLEPPKPKVRIANLHRVLGTDAALDPTAVEKEVRKQMAERQAAHDDRNLARKLTPAERRDKKLRKLFGATAVESGAADVGARGPGAKRGAAAAAASAAAVAAGVDVICSVYRVGRLTDPQHRFKVDANAKENHMTGIMVISDDLCVVVVEGVEKATRRYMKLMMRRIDWSTAPAVGRPAGRDANGEAAMNDADEADEEDRPPLNICTLVWQGTVLRRAFSGFCSETVRSAAAGRQLLEDAGVAHYWDAAAGATEGESVPHTV